MDARYNFLLFFFNLKLYLHKLREPLRKISKVCGATQELPAYFKRGFQLTVWGACLCPARDVLNL